MPASPTLERIDDIGILRPHDPKSLESAVALVTAAIGEARNQGLPRLLVVITTGLRGFRPPGVAARQAMVREWAHAAEGRVRVALVIPADFIDPDKFGVMAAANFGLAGNSFVTEAEALDWLRALS